MSEDGAADCPTGAGAAMTLDQADRLLTASWTVVAEALRAARLADEAGDLLESLRCRQAHSSARVNLRAAQGLRERVRHGGPC